MTAGAYAYSYTPFPDPGTDEKPLDPALVEKFLDSKLDYRSTYRAELMREWTLAKAYVESVQWVRLDVGYDPRRAVRWTEVDPQRQVPKPITNEVLPIFDSAVSRIGQRQSKPSIRSRSNSPTSQAGARLAQDVLEWHFDNIGWSKIRREAVYRMVLYGTGIWKSYWDIDYTDLVRIGVDNAMECGAQCPMCNGRGKGPMMGADGLVSPESLPSLNPSAAPDSSYGDMKGPASFQPSQPPTPTKNSNLGRPGDLNDIASEYSVGGNAPGSEFKGGSPSTTDVDNPSSESVWGEELVGPRMQPTNTPDKPTEQYSLSNPSQTDPSYNYNIEPQDFDCPMCDGTGTQSCGFVASDQNIEPQHLLGVPPQMMPGVHREPGIKYENGGATQTFDYSFPQCPQCGAPLTPYDPTPEEVQTGKDSIGRPLGQDVPKGQARVEAISPFDFFVENEGIDRSPKDGECDEFFQCTPRSLDWLANHFEDTDDIKAEDPNIIAQHHPILGEYSFWSVGSRIAAERNVYQNHVRVREAYKMRSKRYPLGRALVMAGKKVLLDDDLFFESPDQPGLFIPRVQYSVARYLRKDGEFNGQGIVAPLVSLQNRINMTYSQIVDTRERHGTSGLIATRGMKLLGGWIRGFTGRVMLWDVDPQAPGEKPQLFETKLMNEAFAEVQNAVDRMKAIAGEQDVDMGKAPTNVSAASAIQLLQEKSAVRNQERESELMDAEVDVYTHQMQLLRQFAREPREFIKKEGAAWEAREFLGLDLAGQTDVVIEDQASYDKRLFTREGVIQGIQLGLYPIDDFMSKREAIKAMGLPLVISDQQNVQIDDAERKWFNFRDTGYIPAVDEFEDDHDIHWKIYGKFLKSPDGIKMRTQVNWDQIVHAISGWQDKLDQALMMVQQLKQLQNAPPPQQVPGMPPLPPQQPIQTPPILLSFPQNNLEDQILWTWANMLQLSQVQVTPELLQPPTTPGTRPSGFLAFMACAHAHRIYLEKKQAQAQSGDQQAAAPMGGATPAGTLPTPAQPQIPAPGASNVLPQPGGPPV